jgi:hypothetical protein
VWGREFSAGLAAVGCSDVRTSSGGREPVHQGELRELVFRARKPASGAWGVVAALRLEVLPLRGKPEEAESSLRAKRDRKRCRATCRSEARAQCPAKREGLAPGPGQVETNAVCSRGSALRPSAVTPARSGQAPFRRKGVEHRSPANRETVPAGLRVRDVQGREAVRRTGAIAKSEASPARRETPGLLKHPA